MRAATFSGGGASVGIRSGTLSKNGVAIFVLPHIHSVDLIRKMLSDGLPLELERWRQFAGF